MPVKKGDQNTGQRRAEGEARAKRDADKAENPDARRAFKFLLEMLRVR